MSEIMQKGLHCVQGKEQGGERYQVSHYTLVSGCIYRVQSVQVITASTTALLVHVHGHVLHMRDLIRSFVTTNTCTVLHFVNNLLQHSNETLLTQRTLLVTITTHFPATTSGTALLVEQLAFLANSTFGMMPHALGLIRSLV